LVGLSGAAAVHAQTPTPTPPVVPTRPYEGEATPTPRVWCPPSPTPPRQFPTAIYPTAVFTTTRIPTATPTGTPTPTPTPYPGGYKILEIPISLEWDYFNTGPNRLTDTITILSFEVVTGTVVGFGMELSASYTQVGAGPVLDTRLGLLKPSTSPIKQWWFTYDTGNLQQVGFHSDHTLLGYWYPQANQAVTNFENNVLFPRPGVDIHRQNGDGDLWTVFRVNESGSIRLYIDLNASFQSSSKTQRYRGIIYTVWLVYTGDLFYQAPSVPGDCWGNNCAARTPTPTPNVTPTPTPFLTPAPTPTPWGCIELPPDVTPRVRINPRGTCVTLIPATDVLGVQIPDVTICVQDVEISVGYLFGQDMTAWTVRAGLILIAFTLWRILVRR
jgi:hypothetical protein